MDYSSSYRGSSRGVPVGNQNRIYLWCDPPGIGDRASFLAMPAEGAFEALDEIGACAKL